MRLLKLISNLNRKIPPHLRFIISLMLFNIPPIVYLSIVSSKIAPLYVAVVFPLINIAALIAYFKIKVIEIESPIGKAKFKK